MKSNELTEQLYGLLSFNSDLTDFVDLYERLGVPFWIERYKDNYILNLGCDAPDYALMDIPGDTSKLYSLRPEGHTEIAFDLDGNFQVQEFH